MILTYQVFTPNPSVGPLYSGPLFFVEYVTPSIRLHQSKVFPKHVYQFSLSSILSVKRDDETRLPSLSLSRRIHPPGGPARVMSICLVTEEYAKTKGISLWENY